jgi:hypothetical protein
MLKNEILTNQIFAILDEAAKLRKTFRHHWEVLILKFHGRWLDL